ncbi:aminoglycoside 6-adenylyltransferase [Tenggerimyces flavus]|uniref:Aminoglycoside 6-adenylyltransferase n=1 Tax=Tenggerimyces flavus TaxID=1708749 RepID=A0ABV7YKL1_9ACTN|nr:aminoglycoside 6-adenylyltransferase [Tenggerimyces flavus]MBM7789501.1 hypothetical protein [Tenggerimyces flavus]
MRPEAVERALAPLPEGYRTLFDRLLTVVEHDERIRALWLSGSLARGDADAGSDLDVLLAVADDDRDGFAENWREWLATITPTLIARPLTFAPGSFYSLTRDCERLDVVVETVTTARTTTPFRTRLVVLDRDGLHEDLPDPEPPKLPDRERMEWIVEEFFRLLAIFVPVNLVRKDYLLGVVGVQGTRQMLHELFVNANQPLPATGVKQWSSKLTPAQRALMESLPPLDATRESLVPAMLATAEAFRTAGREALEAQGIPWPEDLDHTVSAHVTAALVQL